MSYLKIGNTVEVVQPDYMTKAEKVLLKSLQFKVTIEDLDVVNEEVLGFYSKEFPGYLFTKEDLDTPN